MRKMPLLIAILGGAGLFAWGLWERHAEIAGARKGTRLRLSYGDHNDEFARELPKDGEIMRTVTSSDGKQWVLLKLDAPVTWRRETYRCLLLRSRWRGYPIGGKEPASVFILLVPAESCVTERFRLSAFEHVAWGMVRPATP